MGKFTVEFYTKTDGEKPAKDFFVITKWKNASKINGTYWYFRRKWKSIKRTL